MIALRSLFGAVVLLSYAVASGGTGALETLADVYSPQLDNDRDLAVYLPPSYAVAPERRYPVVYLQDGQNLFEPTSSYSGVAWEADRAADELAARGLEVILVGIPNRGSERLAEYGPFPHAEAQWVGKGTAYAAFVAETVKPLIDATFRTLPEREHAAVVGSSAGGVISLFTALRYPERFGFAGVLSPAMHLGQPFLFDWLGANPAPAARVWVDMGTGEGSAMVQNAQRLADLLGAQGSDVRLVLDEGAEHTESAWAERFPALLEWFLTAPVPRVDREAAAVLERAVVAHGGEGLRGVTALQVTMRNTQFGFGPAGPRPDQVVHLVLNVDLEGERIRAEFVLAGDTFLVQRAAGGVGAFWVAGGDSQPLPPAQALALTENLYVGPIGLGRGAERDFARLDGPMELLGVTGEAVTVVTRGLRSTMLFGSDGLLMAERYAVPGGEAQSVVYRDHRAVGGIVFPHRIDTYLDETLVSTLEVLDLRVDPPLGDADFELP